MLRPVEAGYTFTENLAGEEGGKARDVSGIVCVARNGDRLRCLIVNDENRTAQFIEIHGTEIAPREEIPLIGTEPPSDTLGEPPASHDCSCGEDAFGEFDGEGIAFEAPYVYVAGSHGCFRKKNTFKLSSFYLARFRVDERGRQDGEVETTYRLGDALRNAPTVGRYFARNLMGKRDGVASNGLNVEGIAVVGGRLYAGLRAPSLGDEAYLVSVGVDALFAPGHGRLTAEPALRMLAVGADAGIRDLSALPDGRLLILTGPAQDQDVPHRLFVADPASQEPPKPLGTIEPLPEDEKKGKAEAITMIGDDRVLVLFDSLKNGAPRAYEIALA